MDIFAGDFSINNASQFKNVGYHVFRVVGIGANADSGVLTAGRGGLGDGYSIADFFGCIRGYDTGRLIDSNPFCDFVATGYGRKIGGIFFADYAVGRNRDFIMEVIFGIVVVDNFD